MNQSIGLIRLKKCNQSNNIDCIRLFVTIYQYILLGSIIYNHIYIKFNSTQNIDS